MKKSLRLIVILAAIIVIFQNCKPNNETITGAERTLLLPEKPYDYKAEVTGFIKDLPLVNPQNLNTDILGRKMAAGNSTVFLDGSGNVSFGQMNFFDANGNFITNSNNLKNEIATLGRVLFYDTQLSINNTIACGSCHLQSKAFSDISEGSIGFKGMKTPRNSMAIANPILTRNLFWDSRSNSLQDMVLRPVQNHIEMGMEDLAFLSTKLKNVGYYPALFKQAFGDASVTTERINIALMQFLGSMVSHNSKFDEGAKSNFANFSPLEILGKDLFMSNRLGCVKCHAGANFSLADDQSFDNPYGNGSLSSLGTANIGLDMVYKDNGRGEGKFKIPSLRNIGLTAPYMHDGRFKTLEDVVEHYNSGIKAHPNLDANVKDENGQPKRLNLSALEKNALVAFLKTLTDTKYTSDPKYSDPFKQ